MMEAGDIVAIDVGFAPRARAIIMKREGSTLRVAEIATGEIHVVEVNEAVPVRKGISGISDMSQIEIIAAMYDLREDYEKKLKLQQRQYEQKLGEATLRMDELIEERDKVLDDMDELICSYNT